MKSITYEKADNRPLAHGMRVLITLQPANQFEDLLVGKTATVVGRLRTEPEAWRLSLLHPVGGYYFVDVKPQDVTTLHGMERRPLGANPYTLHKAGRLRD